MTRKRRRLYLLLAGMGTLGLGALLVLNAFQDSLVFFYSPSDLLARPVSAEQRIRVGGLVEPESVIREGLVTRFRVTDQANTLPVTYTGMLPDLFREGQGVVASGRMEPDGQFRADEVLAKHDEQYMPPEVADALRRAGQWKPEEGQ